MRSLITIVVTLWLTWHCPHALAQRQLPVEEQSTELKDTKALEFLKFVADGYRGNRERAREIVAEGTIIHRETRSVHGEPRLDSELMIDFRYWQLG